MTYKHLGVDKIRGFDMAGRQRSIIRDFILLVSGVFLGMVGNFLVEYTILSYNPTPQELPMLVLGMLFLLGFYFFAALYLLWRFG